MTLKETIGRGAKALALLAAVATPLLLAETASARPSGVPAGSPLLPGVEDDVPDRCAADVASTQEELDIRQDRNDWALQCGYITPAVYKYLYQNFWVWKYVSFAKNDRDNGYPLWRPEDFGQLQKDVKGAFVNCGKPADVRLFTMCKAPNDG